MFGETYARFYASLNQSKPYKKDIEFIYEWAGGPSSVLDLGCGTANYWKYYPSSVRIIGIEKSKAMRLNSSYKSKILLGDIQAVNYGILKGNTKMVTAIFDVVNYMPNLRWIERLPLNRGGYFVFDVWSKAKAVKEGFKTTEREAGGVKRTIRPVKRDSKSVSLEITLEAESGTYKEMHKMYLYSEKEIKSAVDKTFDVVEIKETETWQTWWKLRKK